MKSDTRAKRLKLSISLLIIIIGFGIYSNSLSSPFHFDDNDYIVNNLAIRKLTDLGGVYRSIPHPSRFIALVSFAVNYQIHQLHVFGYHLTNLIIHVINAYLVWRLMLLIFSTPRLSKEAVRRHNYILSATTALIFLVHPIQSQAVNSVVQRFTTLATLFYLATLCLYIKGRLSTKKGKKYFMFAALCAVLGMFTKPITFTLPFMVILTEFVFLRYSSKKVGVARSFNVLHLLMVLAFAFIVPAFFKFDSAAVLGRQFISTSHDLDTEVITIGKYFLTQSRVIMTYIKTFLVPSSLNVEYDFRLSHSILEVSTLLSVLVLFAMAVWALVGYRKNIMLSFGLFWFFTTLTVECSIIPLQSVIAEPRMYLPGIGLAIALSAICFQLIRKWRIYLTVLIALITVFSVLTYHRNGVWQSKIRLWSDVVKKSPFKVKAYDNLGLAYLEIKEYQLAKENFQQAIELNAKFSSAYNNLGVLNQELGQNDLALINMEKALAIEPNDVNYLNNRGSILITKGQWEAAWMDLNRAIDLDRSFAHAYNNRSRIYMHRGDWFLAMADLNKALIINPYLAEGYYNRAQLYRKLGNLSVAIDDYTRAIEHNPSYALAFNGRGVCYQEQKKYDLALKDFDQAVELDPDNVHFYNNRGVVHGMAGKKERALLDYNKALALNPNYGRAYINRGFYYLKMGKHDLSLHDFNQAIQTEKLAAENYYFRSLSHYKLGDFKKAQHDLNNAVKLKYSVNQKYADKLKKLTKENQ